MLTRFVDIRYLGQSYELSVPFTTVFEHAFHDAHRRAYGYADTSRPLEVVNARVLATGRIGHPPLPRVPRAPIRSAPVLARRLARFAGRPTRTSVVDWTHLEPGMSGNGPAVVTGLDATAVVPPAWRFRVDAWGNLSCARRSR